MDVTTPTPAPVAETPALPKLEELAPNEYREHRLGGKSIEDIVKARPAPVVETPDVPSADAAEKPIAATERNADGTFKAKPPTQGNPRHDPKARVDELKSEIAALAKERGATKAERDAIAAELVTLRAERDALKAPAKAEPAATAETFPEYADWVAADAKRQELADPYGAWIRAANKFDREQEQRAAETEKQTAARQQTEATAYQTHYDRLIAFKADHPDFDDLVQRSPITKTPPPPHLGEAIVTSEHGPALQYHFLQHPEAYTRLLALSPAAAARELGILQASLTADPTVPAAATLPTTQADAPFETVGASASASTRSLESAARAKDQRRYRELREAGARR